jgi:cell division protein FtsX
VTNKPVSTNNAVATNQIAVAKEQTQEPKQPHNWHRIFFIVGAIIVIAWCIGAFIRLRSKREFDR